MCKNAVKMLPFVIRYISDQYATQEMFNKVILENCGTLKFVPDCYKNQTIWCYKAVNDYPYALEFVPNFY